MKDSRSYSTFSTVCSDHRVISASLKLSLRVSKKAVSHPMKSIDWKKVASDSQMCKDFTIQVFNKFQLLSTTEVDTENVEDVYSKLIKSTEEVALATLPKKKRRSESKPTASQSPKVCPQFRNPACQVGGATYTQGNKSPRATSDRFYEGV